MSEKYLKVIEVLTETIMNNELKLSVLEYENKILKDKIKSYEDKHFGVECE